MGSECFAYQVLEVEGARYAVLPETMVRDLADRAKVSLRPASVALADPSPGVWESSQLARRLRERRQRVGLTQVELARRAGVRVETLNRIERGHTTPDFATVRKLVVAIAEVEKTQMQEARP
jgi:DNA-binding XRE family transcriptional regulator